MSLECLSDVLRMSLEWYNHTRLSYHHHGVELSTEYWLRLLSCTPHDRALRSPFLDDAQALWSAVDTTDVRRCDIDDIGHWGSVLEDGESLDCRVGPRLDWRAPMVLSRVVSVVLAIMNSRHIQFSPISSIFPPYANSGIFALFSPVILVSGKHRF